MATLALPPTSAATQPAEVDPNASEKPSADGSAADPSGIDPGWVVIGKSDVVPAELAAAAAAAGHRRLGFSPLPMIPIWVQMVLGGVVYTAVPFYKRVRKVEDPSPTGIYPEWDEGGAGAGADETAGDLDPGSEEQGEADALFGAWDD